MSNTFVGQTPKAFMDHGRSVVMIASPRSHTIETWVQGIVRETGLRLDWRLVGGRAIVLVIGDDDEFLAARAALEAGWERLVDAYMICPDNFTRNPERRDVMQAWFALDGRMP
jgi:hypothetical protein